MACPRCGNDCNCACSGDPRPAGDWRAQVAMQVRAHKVRKHRRLDPDSPQLEFGDQELPPAPENSTLALRAARWRDQNSPVVNENVSECDDSACAVIVRSEIPEHEATLSASIAVQSDGGVAAEPRPPLAPFPRIHTPAPKIIEFPRMQARTYELAEPVADQLRIFEAIEELPQLPPSPLAEIEIAPEPVHSAPDFEIPIQAAPLSARAYAAAIDAIILMAAAGVFIVCAQWFMTTLPATKPLVASAAGCTFLLLTVYYLLSLSTGRGTPGMEASGLRILTFSGEVPSRMRMRWRALATVLSCATLGLGFGWSLIDDDQLCWHDRITHTYLAANPQ